MVLSQDGALDPECLAKAWQYHHAADQLLHSRIESLLIAHAFLAAAYAQIVVGSSGKAHAEFVGALIIVLAMIVTPLFMSTTAGLLRGTLHLKREFLIHDPIYEGYLKAVAEDYPRRWFRPAILPIFVPLLLIAFWALVGWDRWSGGNVGVMIFKTIGGATQ